MLSYQWDQMDAGCATDASSFGTDTGSNALFRSYTPRDDVSARHFPALGTQLRGLYDDAEVLPCQKRDLNFRLTVRDGSSGQDARNLKVSVVKRGGRFRITSLDVAGDDLNTPGQTLDSTLPVTVRWNVAKTDKSPVSCANVDIELMTFAPAYATYTVHPLLMMTPNDDNEVISVVPAANSHPRARIRIKCSDNIFYDISDEDFAISGTGATFFDDTAMETFFNDKGTTGMNAPACRKPVKCKADADVNLLEGSGRGSSALDYRWLSAVRGITAGATASQHLHLKLRACSAA